MLTPEWRVFADPEHAGQGPDFRLKRRRPPAAYSGVLEDIVAVTRLREVSALYGFSRIVAPNEAIDGVGSIAPLVAGDPTWLPCAQTRGEGVFLRLRLDPVLEWQRRCDGSEPVVRLQLGHASWCARRGVRPERRWPGVRFVLLHTLAHALIREFALECGYTASGPRVGRARG